MVSNFDNFFLGHTVVLDITSFDILTLGDSGKGACLGPGEPGAKISVFFKLSKISASTEVNE